MANGPRLYKSSDPFWKESLERDHAQFARPTRRADEVPELRCKFLVPKTTYQSWTTNHIYTAKPLIPDEKEHWRALEAGMRSRREPHNIFNISEDTEMKIKMQRLRAQISLEREKRHKAEEEVKSRRAHQAQELRLHERTRRGLRLSPRLTAELMKELEGDEAMQQVLARSGRSPRRS